MRDLNHAIMLKLTFFVCLCVLIQAQDSKDPKNKTGSEGRNLYPESSRSLRQLLGNGGLFGGLLDKSGLLRDGIQNRTDTLSDGLLGNKGNSTNDINVSSHDDPLGIINNRNIAFKDNDSGTLSENGSALSNITDSVARILVSILTPIDNAMSSFGSQLTVIKQKLWADVDRLKDKADLVQEKFREMVDGLAENLRSVVSNMVDGQNKATPCGNIVLRFKDKILDSVLNTTQCARNVVEEVIGLARIISDAGDRIRENLILSRKDAIQCAENMQGGVKFFMAGLKCMTQTSITAGVIIATEIPTFFIEATKAGNTIMTMPVTVEACVTSGVLQSVSFHYRRILQQVGKCVKNFRQPANTANVSVSEVPNPGALLDEFNNIFTDQVHKNTTESFVDDLNESFPFTEYQTVFEPVEDNQNVFNPVQDYKYQVNPVTAERMELKPENVQSVNDGFEDLANYQSMTDEQKEALFSKVFPNVKLKK